ncbi:MAG: hypothetical protein ABF301_01305 [Sulfurovum sp.]|jgi:multidrug efflux pump subunit AcrA (membrane-fusion protein)
MKVFFGLILSICTVFANEYYAKLEPIQNYVVKSSVSGKVVYSNTKVEGNIAKNDVIIEIDTTLNKIELEQSKNKLNLVNEMIDIEALNLDRLNKVTSKSQFEKDTQKLKVINLQSTKADLLIKIETLKDTLKNKKLVEKSKYISNIYVKEGDYVNPGTSLYDAKDVTKAKLEVYIPIDIIDDIKTKTIYLDGKETNTKINKIYNVADENHISSYKVQLLVDKPKAFSRLVKIEFK